LPAVVSSWLLVREAMGAATAGERNSGKQGMYYVPVAIIGAGQAGLAMSRCLTQRRIEHVALERGRIAERWRSERWDSLRLLTPNWMTRLPGWSYDCDDPDGYMTAPEFVRYLADYAGSSGAPIKAGTTVLSVRSTPFGYRVETNWFGWEKPTIVVRDCVPPTQRLCARKRNWASVGCKATAPIVAKSFGVSTPLRGAGGAFRAGISIVVTGASMSDLHWVDVLTDALACPGRFDRTSEGRLRRWKAGKGQDLGNEA